MCGGLLNYNYAIYLNTLGSLMFLLQWIDIDVKALFINYIFICNIVFLGAGLEVFLPVKHSMLMFMQETCGCFVMVVLVFLILVCV